MQISKKSSSSASSLLKTNAEEKKSASRASTKDTGTEPKNVKVSKDSQKKETKTPDKAAVASKEKKETTVATATQARSKELRPKSSPFPQTIAAAKPSSAPGVTVRRSYVMVVSSYENVAKQNQLTGSAAEQFGNALQLRLNELNKGAVRDLQELPEFKNLGIDDMTEFGEEIGEMMADDEDHLKAFALLKSPTFARYMESSESLHRSFSEVMKDQGDEQLLFGALDVLESMGKDGDATPMSPAINIRV